MATNTPLLSVENLQTQFETAEGTVRAVDGISFDVHEGETVGLVGESGAGKSVAISSILRLVESPGEIVGGEIQFRGETLISFEQGPDGQRRRSPETLSNKEFRKRIRGREIATIFQDPMESLNPVFTIGSQLQEFIEINRNLPPKDARDVAIEALREVDLPKPEDRFDDYPHEFSGGMRQRVLIAMAIACQPSLILADEPTTALDVTVEGQILNLVSDLQDEYGTSFVWVTHDLAVVADICDRVNVMYLGQMAEQAEVHDLFDNTEHPYTEALLNSVPRPDKTVESLTPIKGVMPEAIDPPSGCRFHPRCPDAREVCREFNPEPRNVSDTANRHNAACVKHDAFDVDYEHSTPIQSDSDQFGEELQVTEGNE
ncbi:ABC transporter ATP-binding protein [Halorubrum ezzemoulense]|uniref:Nickel import system ATP-binding protein NikD n=1 Tax=Halorubrum ezzemoulense TaxID=337243 RepID=A0A256JJA9_HALEZ|nr:ABC transporter ATP-binding protein [Halorubrum ezzemoulense]OYR68949.1 ABC transporter ATP-binding protein [Halorubrum ezzemoulense]